MRAPRAWPKIRVACDQHVRLEDHEGRIKALEVASVERIVSRAESAAGWRAMEAAALATPDETFHPGDEAELD